MSKRIPLETELAIVRQYIAGDALQKIVAELDLTSSSRVYEVLRRRDIKLRGQSIVTPKKTLKLAGYSKEEYLADRRPDWQIAESLGVCVQHLSKWKAKHRIKRSRK